MNAFAFETVTAGVTSIGLTASNIEPNATPEERDRGKARMVFITVEGVVRYRLDGTAPTGDVGHELRDGDSLTLVSESQMRAIRFIRRTDQAADAKLRVTYFR
jgi:hypothetical protein